MKNHIHFSAIKCKFLEYINKQGYTCLVTGNVFGNTEHCMRCKFAAQKDVEAALRASKKVKNG